LKQQVEAERNNAKGLNAQLDACKQMFNDGSASILQLRTQLNLVNGNMQEMTRKIASDAKELEDNKNQIAALMKQITDLTVKPNGEEKQCKK
jgi:methyl-accepting chemotaxis protein